MTKRQKLEIERSTKVQRLNALLDLEGDALTDELRSEMDAITTRMPGLETEMRAAITAEAAEEAEARGAFGNNGDGEAAEVRQLMGAVTINDYLGPATAGSAIEGRAAELNAALEVSIAGRGAAWPFRGQSWRLAPSPRRPRTMAAKCSGPFSSACSALASWMRSAFAWTPCRPGVPNGR